VLVALLTVLIPTRNRPDKAALQINNLLKILENLQRSDYQIVVSDNSDVPLELSRFEDSISVIRSKNRFRTFEEHFFWAIHQVDGEYIWTLGDDDTPIAETVLQLVKIIKNNSFDILVFNGEKKTKSHRKIKLISSDEKCLETSYRKFITSSGYWSVGAGISLHVVRKKYIQERHTKEILKLNSPIYSHVALFLEAFKNATFVFVNKPLVIYHKSDPNSDAQSSELWEKYAIERKTFYRHPWILGFLRQISYLDKNDAYSFEEASLILEYAENRRRYFLMDSFLSMLTEELSLYLREINGDRRRIRKGELKEIKALVSKINHIPPELIMCFQGLQTDRSNQSKFFVQTLNLLQQKIYEREKSFSLHFSGKVIKNYSVFQLPYSKVYIDNNYELLYNQILVATVSKLGTAHLSKLPIRLAPPPNHSGKEIVYSRFKVAFLLITNRYAIQYIKSQLILKIKKSKKLYKFCISIVRTIRNLSRINKYLAYFEARRVKSIIHLFLWKWISMIWLRISLSQREKIKKKLKRYAKKT
jgi:hypothetical protein